MTVTWIQREDMVQAIHEALSELRNGKHEELRKALIHLETVILRDGAQCGYKITAAEEEFISLLIPYVRMLGREHAMLSLVSVGGDVAITAIGSLSVVSQNSVCSVMVPSPKTGASACVILLPLAQPLQDLLSLDAVISSVFHT